MLTNSVGKDTFYLLLLGRYKLSYKGQWFGLRGTPSTVWVSLIVLKSCLLKAQSDHAYVSVYETALFLSLLSSEAGEDSHDEKSIGKKKGLAIMLVRGFCRKFCSGGHAGAVAPACGGIRRPGSRTIRPQ